MQPTGIHNDGPKRGSAFAQDIACGRECNISGAFSYCESVRRSSPVFLFDFEFFGGGAQPYGPEDWHLRDRHSHLLHVSRPLRARLFRDFPACSENCRRPHRSQYSVGHGDRVQSDHWRRRARKRAQKKISRLRLWQSLSSRVPARSES